MLQLQIVLSDVLCELLVDEPFLQIRVVPILDLVAVAAWHMLGTRAPAGAVLKEQLDESDVFFISPWRLVRLRVQLELVALSALLA